MTSTHSTTHEPTPGLAGAVRSDQRMAAPWIASPPLAALLCFLLSLAMHLPWLGVTPVAGTEGHRIFPAHEMVRSHNWLVPMMFDQPFMTKPPLHHWLIAVSEILVGTGKADVLANPSKRDLFAWRLPSALAGAALCAAMCLFGARWFGRTAGLISGLCAVGMIAIWGQSQVADIDSTNTLAAALTALCGIELFVASPSRRWRWVAAASAAMAATWMVKGPAGLPIILGVWIWAGVLAFRETRVRIWAPVLAITGKRTWIWVAVLGGVLSVDLTVAAYHSAFALKVVVLGCVLPVTLVGLTWEAARRIGIRTVLLLLLPIVLGLAVFVAWGLLAKESLRRQGLAFDTRGVQEGSKLLLGMSIRAFAKTLFVMLPQLIAFALPVVTALLFLLDRDVRGQIEPRSRRIAIALAAAVLISWVICFIAAMELPRYGYPTLLPLCPLAGAVVVAAAKTPRTGAWLRAVAIGSAVALALAAAGLVVGLWRGMHLQAVSTAAGRVINPSHFAFNLAMAFALLAVVTSAWTVWRLRWSWRGAWGIVVLLMMTSVPFGAQRRWSRTYRDSGIQAGARLKQIVGEHTVVSAGGAVTSKPETFTYANVRVIYYSRLFFQDHVPPGTWVVLDQAERKLWLKPPAARLEKEEWLCRNGQTDYYVAWFAGLQSPVISPAPPAGR